MDYFNYQNHHLYAEDVNLHALSSLYGSPCYIYSRATLEKHWHAFDTALSDINHRVYYAVKANSNIAILNVLSKLGSFFDIVSLGEFKRVIAAGGKPSQMVFSGIGKRIDELKTVISSGIGCINIESEDEFEVVTKLSQELKIPVNIAFRVNPDIDPQTHPYISTGLKNNKFGINFDKALELYTKANRIDSLNITGIAFHIGSQLMDLRPVSDALDVVLGLISTLTSHGIELEHINVGGGIGVKYTSESPPDLSDYGQLLSERLKKTNLCLHIEPGRAIAANAGILLTQVQYLKKTPDKHFAIIDAAMNDLLRPALYQAKHDIIPVESNKSPEVESIYEIVGPVCESSDSFGQVTTQALKQGDLLAIRTAGAYGFSMSSQYNSRPRAAEIMVDKNKHHLIRERESIADLFQSEYLIP